MGKLSGFSHREVVKRLKQCSFTFYRQPLEATKFGGMKQRKDLLLFLIIWEIFPKERYEQF